MKLEYNNVYILISTIKLIKGKAMPHKYMFRNILKDLEAINDSRTRKFFENKYLLKINNITRHLKPNEFLEEEAVTRLAGKEIFFIAIETQYRWSLAQYTKSINVNTVSNTVSSNTTFGTGLYIPDAKSISTWQEALSITVPEDITPKQQQLKALQKINIALFTMFSDSPAIRKIMIRQFCLEAINTDTFGKRTKDVLEIYKEVRLSGTPEVSVIPQDISIFERWSQLKTWQKVLAVISILMLIALTIAAAFSGVLLIAAAFGAAFIGTSSIALGSFGVISVIGALTTSVVAKSVIQNPQAMFSASCLPPEDTINRNNSTNAYVSKGRSFSTGLG